MKVHTLKGLALSAFAATFLLSGCASSERMTRMSGNVVCSYSIPSKNRLRSERYEKENKYTNIRDEKNATLDFNKQLVNIWPLFFSSQEYFSILWPFIDYDKYGFAIRPLYNKEGDDQSILFPLSSWNMADKSGWAAFCVWDKEHFAAYPFAYQSFNEKNGTSYYTPLFIHTWSTNKNHNFNHPLKRGSFTELLLGYYDEDIYADTSAHPALQHYWTPHYNTANENTQLILNELRYRHAKEGKNLKTLPKNTAELKEYREKIYATLPEVKKSAVGFFPLFHFRNDKVNDKKFLSLCLLYNIEKGKNSNEQSLLWGILGKYSTEELKHYEEHAKQKFLCIPLMSGFWRYDKYVETPSVKKALSLKHNVQYNNIDVKSKLVQEKLKEIDPKLVLPETVVDKNTFCLFINDWLDKQEKKIQYSYDGGCLPIFDYEFNDRETFWCIPVLLTKYRKFKEENSSSWYSLPILTWGGNSKTKDYFTIAGPLIFYTKTIRTPREDDRSYLQKRVYTSKTQWASEWDQVEHENTYAALGLLYAGRDVFIVEKENVPKDISINRVCEDIWKQYYDHRDIVSLEKQIKNREANAMARKINNKIDYYQQQIDLEYVKQDQQKLEKKRKEFAEKEKKLYDTLKKLNFTIDKDFYKSESQTYAALRKLYDTFTETKEHYDYGNGIIFRKEKYWNGDFYWKFCKVLAGAEKKGNYESTHILQLLYRNIKDGDKRETLCFPFIAMRSQGEDNSHFSFLWRVFDLKRENGKTSGHFLFIPF